MGGIGVKKYYTEPQLEIRKYAFSNSSITTSDPANNGNNDLNKDDSKGDYFE